MLSLHGQLVLDIRPQYPALPDHDSMNNPSDVRGCRPLTTNVVHWIILFCRISIS